jgi:hypothetical protein
VFAVLKDDDVGVLDEEEEGRSANKRDFVECLKSFLLVLQREQAIRFN